MNIDPNRMSVGSVSRWQFAQKRRSRTWSLSDGEPFRRTARPHLWAKAESALRRRLFDENVLSLLVGN